MNASENPFTQQRLEGLAYRFPDGQSWHENLQRLKQLGLRAAIVGPCGTGKSTLLREWHHRSAGFQAFPISQPLASSPAFPSKTAEHEAEQQDAPKCSAVALLHDLPTVLLDIPYTQTKIEEIFADIQAFRLLNTLPQSLSENSIWIRLRTTFLSREAREAQREFIAKCLCKVDQRTVLLVDGIERLKRADATKLLRFCYSSNSCAGAVIALHHRPHSLGEFRKLPVWIETKPTLRTLEGLIAELDPQDDSAVIAARRLWNDGHRDMRRILRSLYDQYKVRNRQGLRNKLY